MTARPEGWGLRASYGKVLARREEARAEAASRIAETCRMAGLTAKEAVTAFRAVATSSARAGKALADLEDQMRQIGPEIWDSPPARAHPRCLYDMGMDYAVPGKDRTVAVTVLS